MSQIQQRYNGLITRHSPTAQWAAAEKYGPDPGDQRDMLVRRIGDRIIVGFGYGSNVQTLTLEAAAWYADTLREALHWSDPQANP